MPDDLVNNFDDFPDHQTSDILDSDSEDGNEEDYGEKVQKRISKEVQKRKVLEDQLYDQEQRLNDQEQRLSEYDQRFANEEQQQADDNLKKLADKRQEMQEIGEFDQKVEDEYFDAKVDEKLNARQQKEWEYQQAQQEYNKRQQPQIPPAQQEWLKNNEWYGSDPEKKERANGIFKEMIDEGFNTNHPAMYKAFDERLNSERETPPLNGQSNASRQTRSKKRGLSEADLDNMGNFGFNRNSAEDRKSYLER